ncbi:MAG: DNA/RNA nuclease SfsA [Thermoprotei archaeon]|nr:MAG: DNA/RNA nuclease SfsA [Thermoprotei archaeon]
MKINHCIKLLLNMLSFIEFMMFKYMVKSLIECIIVSRINRFVVNVKIDGKITQARITNTGRLYDLLIPGNKGYCIEGGMKTRYKLIGINVGLKNRVALIDTRLQEDVFYNAAQRKYFNWLNPYRIVKRYPKINNSRLDFQIKFNDKIGFIEMKSAVLLFDKFYGGYPDCPSIRGRRHILDIIRLHEKSYRCILLFSVAHPLARIFKPYSKGDPIIADLIEEAFKRGVEIYAFKPILRIDEKSIVVEDEDIPIVFR